MAVHEITIDEQAEPGDRAFAAFCTEECGWRGTWQHSDHVQAWSPSAALDAALDRAEQEGDAHLSDAADESDPAPDIAAFQALPIPTTDQNGYAS